MKIIFAIVMIAVSILFISIGVDTWTTYRNAQNYEQATVV